MKKLLRKLSYLTATLWMTASSLLLATPHALAASATLSISPASTSVSQGSVVSLGIYVNSTDPVNAVQANLSYPANLLDFSSIASSSNFGIEAQSTGGGGSVAIGRGTINPVTGSKLVATVRFKAKASSGTAAIAFASGSGVASNGTAILGATTGATVALKPVPPAAPAAPAPPKDTTPPIISNVKAIDITSTTAAITWTTSEPATSEVSYGTNDKYGLNATTTGSVTDHKVVLDSALMKPGVTYHYKVRSVDPSGNVVAGDDQTFKTAGLSLTITVLDKNGKAVKGASVSFQKQTVTTDKNGKATFKDLSLDSGNAVITQGGNKTAAYVNVVQDGDAVAKAITVKINTVSTSQAPTFIFIGLLVLAVVSLWYFLRRAKNVGGGGGSGVITPAPVVPSSDPDLKAAGPSLSEFKPTPTPPVEGNGPVVIKPDNPAVGSDTVDKEI